MSDDSLPDWEFIDWIKNLLTISAMAASASLPEATKISSICFKSRKPSLKVVSFGLGITFNLTYLIHLFCLQLKSIK